jgi:cytochrome P450
MPYRAKELHDQYGPVVRIAPDELAYTTASAWKDIYGFRQGHAQLPKDLRVFVPRHEGEPPNIINGDDVVHTRYRRLLSHAFSVKALEEQQSVIMSYVNLLTQRLHENASKPQDLVAWYTWTTFDLIGDLSFGEPFGCLLDQRYHPWVKTIMEGTLGGITMSARGRYGLSDLLTFMIPKSLKKNFELMYDYTKEKVACRLERGTERPDFMSHIMRNDKNRIEMTQPEIESNALVLVVAGSETTASLLSGATYYLLMNPRVLARVTKEVRDNFQSDQELDCNGANNLEYLSAVLKEALRMYPPTPFSIPRRILGEGVLIDGRWVPPNVGFLSLAPSQP